MGWGSSFPKHDPEKLCDFSDEIMRQGKSGQRGQLRIHFHSEEELMRLFDVLIERGDNR